jgi:hypothetical protein
LSREKFGEERGFLLDELMLGCTIAVDVRLRLVFFACSGCTLYTQSTPSCVSRNIQFLQHKDKHNGTGNSEVV